MKNENLDDKGQFKMRLDEEDAEASPIPNQVDDMRIEKLSTRMTLITILIPVLIVVVLGIAYMDIKKRVIQTEDTGQLTAESLSKELQSRFESLTMTQKLVEENLSRLKDQSDKSVAKVQINLKKLEDRLASANKKMASQKEFKATSSKLNKNVTNVAQSLEDLKLQLGQINQTLQPQIATLENALAKNQGQMTQLEEQVTQFEEKISTLETIKIDKEKLDYTLKLETLKLKQSFNAQLEELQSRLKSVEKKAAQKPKSTAPAVKAPSSPKPSSAAPTPKTPVVSTPTAPAPAVTTPTTPKPAVAAPSTPPASPSPSSGALEEQTIGK